MFDNLAGYKILECPHPCPQTISTVSLSIECYFGNQLEFCLLYMWLEFSEIHIGFVVFLWSPVILPKYLGVGHDIPFIPPCVLCIPFICTVSCFFVCLFAYLFFTSLMFSLIISLVPYLFCLLEWHLSSTCLLPCMYNVLSLFFSFPFPLHFVIYSSWYSKLLTQFSNGAALLVSAEMTLFYEWTEQNTQAGIPGRWEIFLGYCFLKMFMFLKLTVGQQLLSYKRVPAVFIFLSTVSWKNTFLLQNWRGMY